MNKITEVAQVWCEWDIGLGDTVFVNGIVAWAWLEKNWDDVEMNCTLQEAKEDGLVGVSYLEVIGE